MFCTSKAWFCVGRSWTFSHDFHTYKCDYLWYRRINSDTRPVSFYSNFVHMVIQLAWKRRVLTSECLLYFDEQFRVTYRNALFEILSIKLDSFMEVIFCCRNSTVLSWNGNSTCICVHLHVGFAMSITLSGKCHGTDEEKGRWFPHGSIFLSVSRAIFNKIQSARRAPRRKDSK